MQRTSFQKILLLSSAILCICGCIADLVLIYVFGRQVPGYSQLSHTLSSLGVSGSPVAGAVTLWMVILGLIFIFFAFGFRQLFRGFGLDTRKAFWLIILYSLGECIASGVFRADRVHGELTPMALLHDVFGGIGVIALLLLPLVMRKIFDAFRYPLFFRLSGIVFAAGIVFTILFLFRPDYFNSTFLRDYAGLWQRLFLVNYYIYFIAIATLMIEKLKETNPKHTQAL